MEELVIIGSGPAGLSAALFAERSGISFKFLSRDPEWVEELADDAGLSTASGFFTGYDMLKSLGREVVGMGIKPEKGDAKAVYRTSDSIVVETEGMTHLARSVIIATGRSLRRSEVKGEREFEGRGVSFWPQSDAEKYRGMKIAVICGPDAEAGLVSHICRFASEVYLIGEVKGKITGTVRELGKGGLNEIVGKRMVRGIVVGNETVDVDAVFVNLGFRPNSDLVSGKARLNDLGEIVIDKENNTSIRGVFAAGDVTDINEKQILVAVGEGVKAANSAISYIRSHPESGYEAV